MRRRSQPTRSGYVYLVAAANGLTKIGRTRNLEKRMYALTMWSACSIRLICAWRVVDCLRAEEILHTVFSDKRDHAEWFDLDEADLGFIRKYLGERGVVEGGGLDPL